MTESKPDLLHAVAEASAGARQQFMALVADIRPELHRYCTRMTGSVFDGEDVVQDTLAKAWFALAELDTPPPLRPWLFRIAHNTATDFLRRYEHRHVDGDEGLAHVADVHAHDAGNRVHRDDARTDAALSVLTSLPPVQRSAFAFKDVLDLSLEETAGAMGTTVGAVKAALVRARANVARARDAAAAGATPARSTNAHELERLARYAELFNARDWNALRTFFDEETRLDLVSYRQLQGVPAAQYFTRYAQSAPVEDARLVVGHANGVPVLALFRPSTSVVPAYFVQLAWDGARIVLVRDYRHVSYVARDATFVAMG